MHIRDLLESVAPIKAYHGSNKDYIRSFVAHNPMSKEKESAIFFTDSFDYARQHGDYVYTVHLRPEKPLRELKLSDSEIINTLEKFHKRKIDEELADTILKTVKEQIRDYEKHGNVSGLFSGLGGFQVLKFLGFDIIEIDDDNNIFYLVLDDSIIDIIDVNRSL